MRRASRTRKKAPAQEKRPRPAIADNGIPADLGAMLTDLFKGNFEDLSVEPSSLGQIYAVHRLVQDIAQGGSIMAYLDVTRGAAVGALVDFVDADPGDVGSISKIQRQVGEYLSLVGWINTGVRMVRDRAAARHGDDEGEPIDLADVGGGDDDGPGD